MAARLRAGTATDGRAPDGLDLVRRHEAAAHAPLPHQGRGDCLLRTQGHHLRGARAEGIAAPADRLCRQFLLQARRALDALSCNGVRQAQGARSREYLPTMRLTRFLAPNSMIPRYSMLSGAK